GDHERDRQERADDPGELARGGHGAEVRSDGAHELTTGHWLGAATSADGISVAEDSQLSGLTPVRLAPPGRISKCRCGPVELPVDPTSPIRCPAATRSPAATWIPPSRRCP